MNAFLSAFDNITGAIVGIVWHDNICWVLLAIGLFFTIMTRGVQFRCIPQMFKLLFHSDDSNQERGISNLQALMLAVGGRVGTGNIAGTATAIFMGGPGAIFWMWMSAILGAASAFIECTLAQIYKTRKEDGTYIGGQAYYAERAMGIKWFGTAMAVILVMSNVFGNPCVQSNTISTAVANAFHIPAWIVGLMIAVAMALIIFGGIRRLADLAGKIVPVMCIVYLVIAVILIGANLSRLPGTIGLIFSSAFNPRSAFGGMMGTALVWGVRRGIYSNEAGQGTGTAPAAAVDADHPCDQGLVQALSVYIDTLVVCTISALCMLCTNCYNVLGLDGNMMVEYLPGLPDGIPYVQSAIASVLPLGEIIVAFLITTFAFTSLMSYYLEAEIHITYLASKLPSAVQKTILNVLRLCFLFMVFISSSWPITRVWNITDIGGGILTWAHLTLIVIICGPAVKALRSYDKQRKAGIEHPVFDPVALNIKNADLWVQINKEKGRSLQQ
ncbi:alanine/glycine:cation symporter family protein [Lawsonibacter sp. LCP25S3_G6]|uniref:alanine/glycine:cation symporter family protein n=1 Tax=unclassified Lawsonibacter TaxID=2617946 RepID=UPI003F98D9B8